MAEFPTCEEMAKNVAEKALDEFLYNGKSIREWMQIIASEDCISRQAVLDVMKKHWLNGTVAHRVIDEIGLDINALPSVTHKQRWLPVSERVPEEFQRVLVTIVNYKGDKVVRVAEYYNRKGVGVFQIKENHEQWEVGEEGLLAWTPLPEPYKTEREEEE